MLRVEPFEKFAEEYDAWFEQHSEVYESELLAIRQTLLTLPENISGLEVGVGTGRFAVPLGIKDGVDPAEETRMVAAKRGVEVMDAQAERLPYKDWHFDFVLFVTICHLDNAVKAFKEAHRVLNPGGSLIIGFIDANRPIGQAYEKKRAQSNFYRHATFYGVDRVEAMLTESGFRDPTYVQTLFGGLEDISEVQSPKEGYGEGSFVVVKATKKE